MIISNTDKKPNAVGAAVYKIKELWVCGYSKRDINFKYVESSWNGHEFTQIKLNGKEKIQFEESRGGANRNQGRKLKYGEKTVKVNYRIPVSMKPALDAYIEKGLQKYLKAVSAQATPTPPGK